jgi:hypothetical protein
MLREELDDLVPFFFFFFFFKLLSYPLSVVVNRAPTPNYHHH